MSPNCKLNQWKIWLLTARFEKRQANVEICVDSDLKNRVKPILAELDFMKVPHYTDVEIRSLNSC